MQRLDWSGVWALRLRPARAPLRLQAVTQPVRLSRSGRGDLPRRPIRSRSARAVSMAGAQPPRSTARPRARRSPSAPLNLYHYVLISGRSVEGAVWPGPSVLIRFSSDLGGPSTTLYQSPVVTNTDAAAVTTILSESGPTTDLCSALAAYRQRGGWKCSRDGRPDVPSEMRGSSMKLHGGPVSCLAEGAHQRSVSRLPRTSVQAGALKTAGARGRGGRQGVAWGLRWRARYGCCPR